MTDDKKLVEDWLCEHFPYHLQADRNISKGGFKKMPDGNPFQTIYRDIWMWKDNPHVCYSFGGLYPIGGVP